jgi:hypothetical protein
VADFAALLDANVLYSITKTDLMIELSRARVFRARWTDQIHDEWTRNLQANKPDVDPAKIASRRAAMDKAIRDVLVTGYEPLIAGLTDINPKDRHILAAAIQGQCSVIVTENLKDFPNDVLAPHDIEAQHPDTFLIHQMTLDHHRFQVCAARCRQRMKNPPLTPDEYLARLRGNNLPLVAAELEKVKRLI